MHGYCLIWLSEFCKMWRRERGSRKYRRGSMREFRKFSGAKRTPAGMFNIDSTYERILYYALAATMTFDNEILPLFGL